MAHGGIETVAQSTDLAGHERCFAASGRASIEMYEGQGIQMECTPIPASKAELVYFAGKRKFLLCVDRAMRGLFRDLTRFAGQKSFWRGSKA